MSTARAQKYSNVIVEKNKWLLLPVLITDHRKNNAIRFKISQFSAIKSLLVYRFAFVFRKKRWIKKNLKLLFLKGFCTQLSVRNTIAYHVYFNSILICTLKLINAMHINMTSKLLKNNVNYGMSCEH